mgnify:CR=1 FL=1
MLAIAAKIVVPAPQNSVEQIRQVGRREVVSGLGYQFLVVAKLAQFIEDCAQIEGVAGGGCGLESRHDVR